MLDCHVWCERGGGRTVFEASHAFLEDHLQPLGARTDEGSDKAHVGSCETFFGDCPWNRQDRFDERGVRLVQLGDYRGERFQPRSKLAQGRRRRLSGRGRGGCGRCRRRKQGAELDNDLVVLLVVALRIVPKSQPRCEPVRPAIQAARTLARLSNACLTKLANMTLRYAPPPSPF